MRNLASPAFRGEIFYSMQIKAAWPGPSKIEIPTSRKGQKGCVPMECGQLCPIHEFLYCHSLVALWKCSRQCMVNTQSTWWCLCPRGPRRREHRGEAFLLCWSQVTAQRELLKMWQTTDSPSITFQPNLFFCIAFSVYEETFLSSGGGGWVVAGS